MARTKLLFRAKKIYPDGSIKEMVIWRLPTASSERPHGLKYRLYYGAADGTCLVRYDNETGKGDHRHIAGKERPSQFRDIETMIADFQRDIERAKEEKDEQD